MALTTAPLAPTAPSIVPYLTAVEAAGYLRYRGASGIRAAVRRGELIPDGAGPRGTHLFRRDTLDQFVRTRARLLGRLASRPVPGDDYGKDADEVSRHRAASEEPTRDPGAATCPRTGRRKEVRREEACTLTEARALQQKWREELERGLIASAAPRVRLRDFVRSWLRGRIEAGKLKPSSAAKISTKTGTVKLVPLLPVVAEALWVHRRRMVVLQHPGLRARWIFPNEAGNLHKGSPLRTVLDEACAAASVGRRVTPHGLRHTANDLLRRVALAEVTRAIVGHATEQMSHHYSHVDENEKRAAAARVLVVLNGGKGVETGVADRDAAAEAEAPQKKNPARSPG